jgi:hypothetical protein
MHPDCRRLPGSRHNERAMLPRTLEPFCAIRRRSIDDEFNHEPRADRRAVGPTRIYTAVDRDDSTLAQTMTHQSANGPKAALGIRPSLAVPLTCRCAGTHPHLHGGTSPELQHRPRHEDQRSSEAIPVGSGDVGSSEKSSGSCASDAACGARTLNGRGRRNAGAVIILWPAATKAKRIAAAAIK